MNEIVDYLDRLIPDPKCELNYNKDYELLLATMLSAQTTDKRVNMVTAVLFDKYPSLKELSEAPLDDLITIIKPLGTFRKKALNVKSISLRLIEESDSIVPNDRTFLESLPGVGRKTANVVMSNLFDEQVIAVDTHVSRVSIRLGIAPKGSDVLTIEKKLNKYFPKEKLNRLHHQLVLFGRYYCKAINPSCTECELKNRCKYYKKNNR